MFKVLFGRVFLFSLCVLLIVIWVLMLLYWFIVFASRLSRSKVFPKSHVLDWVGCVKQLIWDFVYKKAAGKDGVTDVGFFKLYSNASVCRQTPFGDENYLILASGVNISEKDQPTSLPKTWPISVNWLSFPTKQNLSRCYGNEVASIDISIDRSIVKIASFILIFPKTVQKPFNLHGIDSLGSIEDWLLWVVFSINDGFRWLVSGLILIVEIFRLLRCCRQHLVTKFK